MMKRRIARLEQILRQMSGSSHEEYCQARYRLMADTRNSILRKMNVEDTEPARDSSAVASDRKLVDEYEALHGIPDSSGSRERIIQKLDKIRKRLIPAEFDE